MKRPPDVPAILAEVTEDPAVLIWMQAVSETGQVWS